MNRKITWLTIISVLLIGGYMLYRMLMPAGPILDELPNPVVDKSDGLVDESSVPRNPLKEAYFGDLHIHTGMSLDAYIGGIRTTPDQAYRFAKGESLMILDTVKATSTRPLDFAAVTDHSEFLGELYSIHTRGAPAHRSMAAIFLRRVGLDTLKQQELFLRTTGAGNKSNDPGFRTHLPFFQGFKTTTVGWDIHLQAANDHYEPGKFTTLAGYEWSLGGAQSHMHRNIFFGDMNVPTYPVSSLEARNELELWQALEKMKNDGADVMAVPHNSNLSVGKTFTHKQPDGSAYDQDYAALRNEFEPLVEIHQAKGNSEVNAALWPNDEFANFENYGLPPDTVTNYVRHALKMGLEHQNKLGVNPFKYGLIGSTDTHNGTPGNAEEDDRYIGNHALLDSRITSRRTRDFPGYNIPVSRVFNPGGLTGVWAEANIRSEIFGAMRRKETFATSGTRIKVRLFAGQGFKKSNNSYEDLVRDGYENGVPMGGDITLTNGAPEFLVWAVKDPIGANLDRVQIIKGWYVDGEMQEKIYNVAISDDRIINADGSVNKTEATVDISSGELDELKGSVELTTVWKDPEFDANVASFYYVRVIENPTLRWSAWDKIRYDSKFPEDLTDVIQERAWSSPVWYTPK